MCRLVYCCFKTRSLLFAAQMFVCQSVVLHLAALFRLLPEVGVCTHAVTLRRLRATRWRLFCDETLWRVARLAAATLSSAETALSREHSPQVSKNQRKPVVDVDFSLNCFNNLSCWCLLPQKQKEPATDSQTIRSIERSADLLH